ncbi:MAG: tetratricopeptide repeat protein [Candidatus Kapaibacteriota bacterium]
MNQQPSHLVSRLLFAALIAIGVSGCAWYDNQTTYFNTYYNMQRIMHDVKDEFAFIDQGRRVTPRVLVPGLDSVAAPKNVEGGTRSYTFLKTFMIDRGKLQPVAKKVDSILMKGSKILSFHPKSDYIQGSLFMMAESYFFRQEWVPSQQKCVELIERFADGDYSPDAHLLLSKDYLLQRKVTQGKQMLSRTVDVAWYKDRYDILGEAYRIQAEMALEEGDLDGAVAPYKQAIAQSEDDEIRATWQVDVAALYYRMGKYQLAEEAFRAVDSLYTPDILAEFESQLYLGATLVRLDRLEEAEDIFVELEENDNFNEWTSFITAERLALQRAKEATKDSTETPDPALIAQQKKADSAYVGRPEMMAQNFQKAMDLYKQSNYEEALVYFAKAKVIRTPVYEVASKYFNLLKQWEDQQRKVAGFRKVIVERESMRDSIAIMTCKEVYGLARIHEQLGNTDSALYYYRWAYDSTAGRDPERSKYLYAQARVLAPRNPEQADSLFMVLNERYPNSPYGKEASASLGFVADAIADDASELYRSGMSFRRIKDYAYATRQLQRIAADYKDSPYAAKALYALGWMQERDLDQNDSALYYYGLLVERYPRSEYAKEVRPSVEYALAKANDVEIADSTLLRDLDSDLLEKATAGQKNVMQQMLEQNKDALNLNGQLGNMQLPDIPGLTPGGGSLNDAIKGQIDKARGVLGTPGDPASPPAPSDSTGSVPSSPPLRKP